MDSKSTITMIDTNHLIKENPSLTPYHSTSLNEMMKGIVKDRKFKLGLLLLDRTPPTSHPPLIAYLITGMGQLDLVEAALKVYKTYSTKSTSTATSTSTALTINPLLQTSLIGLLVRRKETVPAAFDEMDKWVLHLNSSGNSGKMPPLIAQNHLLNGCAKIGDLKTALGIWDVIEKNYKPDIFSYSAFLWVLASSTGKGKKFAYSTTKKEIVESATKVWERMTNDTSITIDPPSVSAILSVYCNFGVIDKAEEVFHKFSKDSNPFHHELMFLMYSKRKDLWYSALALWMTYTKDPSKRVILPLEGWRGIVKSATMANELEYASEILERMVKEQQGGMKGAVFKDFIFLHMRCCESSRRDLIVKMRPLFVKESEKKYPNAVLAFKKRSVGVGDLLAKILSKDAPKTFSEERSRLPSSEVIKNRIRKSGKARHMYEYRKRREKYTLKSIKTLTLNK